MNAKLLGVSGPLKGAVLELGVEDLTVGREKYNALVIEEPSVSRQHCRIQATKKGHLVRDLESRNGTYVNGLPVKERILHEGDQIQIGNCCVMYLVRADSPSHGCMLQEESVHNQNTVMLRREDAVYLRQKLDELPRQSARVAADLNVLFKVSAVISSARGLEELQRKLLESLFEVVPAQRGAILLMDKGSEDFASVFTAENIPNVKQPIPVSRTIVRQVLRDKIGILNNDLQASQTYTGARSLMDFDVRSVLAVPLVFLDQVLGLIYLSTTDPDTRFDEGHLQLLTGIAGIAVGALDNARQTEMLQAENRRLQAEANIEHNMVGNSPSMRAVYQVIAKVALTNSTVLVRGESGTGKELVARAIHRNSPRASRPFVAINCAALTETLVESELFGHEKGAFTGAIAQKKGKLEEGNGGTVFLDEIGEVTPALQVKLLRVLQEREFERVGGTRSIKADIRLIAATNRDLEEAVKQGTFRQDLYYRLNVVSIALPPLRERRDDILMLAGHFVAKYSKLCNRAVVSVSDAARKCLLAHEWQGNVRELENAIERAVVLGSTPTILPEDLPEAVVDAESHAAPVTRYHEAVREAKKQLVLKTFEQAEGNHNEAARLLDLHPNNLHRLIRELDLKQSLKK
jgi:Nif-specific regulatory protein